MLAGIEAQTVDTAALRARAKRQYSATPRAFLRWAGSKRQLLPELVEYLPPTFGRYWEPFLGGGSLFFLLAPTTAVISDLCEPLIETYGAVQADVDAVLRAVEQFGLGREEYYRVRSLKPITSNERAARFIYLNKMGWNGLYRVNGAGEFNVPYGQPKTANVIDESNLRSCALALRNSGIAIRAGDFGSVLEGVKPRDLVFLDPPYVTGHNNNGFIDYNRTLFAWDDQVRLADAAETIRRRGAHVLIANACHPAVLELYPNFQQLTLKRSSTLAADKKKRGKVQESLLVG